MTKCWRSAIHLIAAIGFVLVGAAGLVGCSDTAVIQKLTATPDCTPVSLTYPYQAGQLSFPKDEGRHSLSEWPMTLVEWYAFYAHLTAEDGTRYLLFSTFVTYDAIEPVLNGRFPHVISTLVDVTNNATYHHTSMAKLKRFAEGHADAETAKGDYFRWKGMDKPFEYDFHVAWRDSGVDYAADLDLKMIKLPLVVNGTGYIKQPQGDSGYYSQTRVKATGQLSIHGAKKKVSGIMWVDRQWLGAPSVDSGHYTYDWWALQLDNNEEAIMYRIWDTRTKKTAATLLEINHADGTREHVDEFAITDLPSGWRLSARKPGWDMKIIPACQGHKPGGRAPTTYLGTTWHSCNVAGTICGKRITGVAAAELVPNNPMSAWMQPESPARPSATSQPTPR